MKFLVYLVAIVTLFNVTRAYAQAAGIDKAPLEVLEAVAAGQSEEIIVLFDDIAVQNEAATMRSAIGSSHDTSEILEVKKARYEVLKQEIMGILPVGEQEVITDYSHLPMVFMRVDSLNSMQRLLSQPGVLKIFPNGVKYPVLTSSLPFINQPQVAALGLKGGNTAVAVLDTGVNYLHSAFNNSPGSCGTTPPADCCPGGNCLAAPPAAPAGCKVACVHDFAPSDGVLDDNGHGSNVSGIVAGVAPDTKIIGLDVFTGSSGWDSDIIAAINWVIAKKSAYNIVAMNLSLGDGANNPAPCPDDVFAPPINNAKAAGILAAIASGNDSYIDGISSPACVPAAVSVGAVYDGNIGGVGYSGCTDSTTAPDKVTCFSNSSNFLTILAPGADITAGGWIMYGTSQATPHIAGSIAVLKGAGAFPSDTPDQTVQRMTGTGVLVTDSRNFITKPRINLLAATAGAVVTYSISGTVTLGGNPLSGVTMTLSGAASSSTTTDASGNYSFSGLANGNYTVTPSRTGYTFTPVNRAVTVSGANVTGQNFTAQASTATYSISGSVATSGGIGPGGGPLSGVTMTLSGAASGTTTTNASGNYSFTGLATGNYTVTPAKPGNTFTPVNRAVTVSGANVTGQNFTAQASTATYSISGTVTSGGSPLSGVSITLSGASSGTTTTNASGNYTFTGLANGNYAVTPGLAGYTFTPTNRAVTISSANVSGQNFTAQASAATYSISGTVTSGGNPLSGVTMTLSGAASSTTTTNASGNYSFSGLANGNYIVTPGLAGYTFTPTNRAVTISSANVTGQDFTAQTVVPGNYSISGNVATSGGGIGPGGGSGSPLSGVTMTLSGASSGTTTTDASGNYTFSGLANGSYTVAPSRTGYTFTPVNRAVTISSANVTGQNFTAQAAVPGSYSISGTVTLGVSPLSGVAITLSGASSGTTTTDASGNYSFTGLANGSYTVTPGLAGYTFTPVNRAVTVSGANVTGQNFTAQASAATYSISGSVATSGGIGPGGGPLSGVTMTLSGAASGTITTNASGNYSFTGLANGNYTVTPAKPGNTFTPVNRAVTVSGANVTGQNFTGN
ncbi:MAG: carboxypeptidase regulatory-like domain-containing protein [Nitrospirae bacterium]|nr:carboxypeptidase regulatory-like domain-containing protein [Nitrospirota bacterium]